MIGQEVENHGLFATELACIVLSSRRFETKSESAGSDWVVTEDGPKVSSVALGAGSQVSEGRVQDGKRSPPSTLTHHLTTTPPLLSSSHHRHPLPHHDFHHQRTLIHRRRRADELASAAHAVLLLLRRRRGSDITTSLARF